MTPEQIVIQRNRLLFEEQMWRASMNLGEISRNCTEHVVIRGRTLWSPRHQKVVNTQDGLPDNWNDGSYSMSCAICGKDLGWHCPVNPKQYCEYDYEKHGENCIHCHIPEERK